MTAYVREILKSTAPELAGTIAVYRAGYRQAGQSKSVWAGRWSGRQEAGTLQRRWRACLRAALALASTCPALLEDHELRAELMMHQILPTHAAVAAHLPCSPAERREIERALFQGKLRAGEPHR